MCILGVRWNLKQSYEHRNTVREFKNASLLNHDLKIISVVRYLIPLDFDAQIEIMTHSKSIFSKESENGR